MQKTMNSIQISDILSNNRITHGKFMGVFAADTLKTFSTYPYCLVVNSDKQSQRGTHLMAIYVPKSNNIEYFDSLAEKPNEQIERFLNKFNHVKMNHKKIQSSFDTSCGAHVIYFIIHRCAGHSFDSIVRGLHEKFPFSDYIVKAFVIKLIAM